MMGDSVKVSGRVLFAGLALLLSACETISRGTEQDVTIETKPAGATVALSDGQRCTSPCRVTLRRYQSPRVTISKPGCRTVMDRFSPSVTDGSIPLGEVSFDETRIPLEVGPGLYRTIYDYQLGGAYDIEPAALTVSLVCGEAARQTPPSLTPQDKILLEQFNQPLDAGILPPGPPGLPGSPGGSTGDYPFPGLYR